MNQWTMAAAAALFACGGSNQGKVSIISSIPGVAFDAPMHAASNFSTSTCGSFSSSEVFVTLTPYPDACAALGRVPNRSTPVTVNLIINSDPFGTADSVLAPGNYAVTPPVVAGQRPAASVSLSITTVDADGTITTVPATDGIVTIDSIEGNAVSGSFNGTGFTFPAASKPQSLAEAINPGTLVGTFSAVGCSLGSRAGCATSP